MLFDFANDAGPDGFFAILGPLVVFGYLLCSYYVRQKHTEKLYGFVVDHGWNWHDDLIPELPYRELLDVPRRRIRISNGFSGMHKGVSFICAEYRVGWGRQSYTTTMLAINSGDRPAQWLSDHYIVKQLPGWYGVRSKFFRRFIYGQRFSAEKILSILDSIA